MEHAMSIWWQRRRLMLSLSGIVAAIGVAGGFDAHHFPADFMMAATVVVILLGIPIVAVTTGLLALETRLGRSGRYVVATLCAAPGLCLWVLFAQGGGNAGYAFTVVVCFFAWAAHWFMTAPHDSEHHARPT
jgi:hypothetical protein